MSFRDNQIIRPIWPFALNHLSPQARGLVAWWPLPHPGGHRIFDFAGYGNNSNGGSMDWTAGIDGLPVMGFDGTNHFQSFALKGPPVLIQGPVSVCQWLRYPTSAVGTKRNAWSLVLDDSGTANNSIQLELTTGSNIEATKWGDLTLVGTPHPGANQWHHIVYTYDGTTHRLYINGFEKANNTTAGNSGTATVSRIGSFNNFFPDPKWLGQIGESRLYNRVLSPSEVFAQYDPLTRYELYYQIGKQISFLPLILLSLVGSISSTASLVKQDQKPLSGTITPIGSLVKAISKSASGVIPSVAGILKQGSKLLGGVIASAGAVAKQTSKRLSGSIASSAVINAIKVVLLSLSGSIAISGTLKSLLGKVLSGSIALAGTVASLVTGSGTAKISVTITDALITTVAMTHGSITSVAMIDTLITTVTIKDELGGG